MITGKTLIDWGYAPGPWFKAAIEAAEAARQRGADEAGIRAAIAPFVPVVPVRPAPGRGTYQLNIRAEGPEEAANLAEVERHMTALMRVPTIKAGAVMPDACPAGGALGTIPVGGVVAAENAIHPGMHSSDICCSMAVTVFKRRDEPKRVLDAAMKHTHFGPGGRPAGDRVAPPAELIERFEGNDFLKRYVGTAAEHFATQGDGNHFLYVGHLASSGRLALVTHHGSRKPGAMLYKAGMAAAERMTRRLSPETPRHNAWIPADTDEGRDYWEALQVIRAWTKANHYAIHDLIARTLGNAVEDRFWNEHNFVFRRADGLFYHGKGATPAWRDFAPDSNGLTLIPLNMREPILIARGLDAGNGLGFAPHGAGRNMSRSAYLRQFAGRAEADVVADETKGIDARFYCGIPDLSELPGAYKNAAAVRAQIAEYGLAEVVDTIEPAGSIMAGHWQREAPWRKKKT